MKNPQFLEFYSTKELESLLEDSEDEIVYNIHLAATSMYDKNGMEITDHFRNQDDINNQVSSGIGTAELFLIYVYIAIVLGLGFIFTRYFLTE